MFDQTSARTRRCKPPPRFRPLAAIGVHRLCVPRVQKGVALDERLRRPLLRGGCAVL